MLEWFCLWFWRFLHTSGDAVMFKQASDSSTHKIPCYVLQGPLFCAFCLLFPPLRQPSTLSLKARHTTAFWWPLYSLLISPVSTHHSRARLSDEAVGKKIIKISHWLTIHIYSTHSEEMEIKKLSYNFSSQRHFLFRMNFHSFWLTGNNILRVSWESTVPHPAPRCLSRIVALDAQLRHEREVWRPPDLAGLVSRAGSQKPGDNQNKKTTILIKVFELKLPAERGLKWTDVESGLNLQRRE